MKTVFPLTLAAWCLLPISAAESIGGKAPPRAARSVRLQWQALEQARFTASPR